MQDQYKNKIVIIDYGLGNLFSVQYACSAVGLESVITADRNIIMRSSGIILPGVGAFGDAMNNLKRLDLINVIKDCVELKKPFLGICLGMQLLFTESEEFGMHKGLDIIKGKVVKFKQTGEGRAIKIPQVGWNQIYFNKKRFNPGQAHPLKGISDGEYMYFVHSYCVVPDEEDVVCTATEYENIRYCSAVSKDSVFAAQFHPEKSGIEGMKIYKNWADIVHADKELVNR